MVVAVAYTDTVHVYVFGYQAVVTRTPTTTIFLSFAVLHISAIARSLLLSSCSVCLAIQDPHQLLSYNFNGEKGGGKL